MQDYEKLGVFYLGREYDLSKRDIKPDPLLYDAKDLTTHAVCVGMTGSGKTGLCLALLEEAAIDGVPAIAIDPKGDLSNLLLTFPELRPEDFRPWVEESEATRKGISPDDLAAQTAELWREGLRLWDQDGARIARFRAAADVAIYTPGSSAGLPLTVLRSFAAPPAALIADNDAFRQRIASAASGLLALVGVDADPMQSREHILLSQVLDQSWRQQQDLDIGGLIRAIQSPSFDRVGFVDLETFYPAKERFELAMRLNNLLASPSFAGWLEGEPLDVARLLHTAEGKPRLSILSIAHLSDAERMFFVTILLNEVLAWARTQPGTSSLRAILYMDEVFGYFPPTANPPSKTPMLTLLKQARAYGLGIVLATQNPVDLDYKGLSNAGTWFLGRLQTERDKARVLEGLEGASAAAGAKFDRAKMDAMLAGLESRVFLMNNVHDDQPIVFQSRWCLSYLRGPLTRGQIQTLMSDYKRTHLAAPDRGGGKPTLPARESVAQPSPTAVTAPATSVSQASPAPASKTSGERPLLPAEAGECFLSRHGDAGADQRATYQPALYGAARLHFVDSKADLDHWQDISVLAPLTSEAADAVWEEAKTVDEQELGFDSQPKPNAGFATLPSMASRPKNYTAWQKSLAAHLYRTEILQLWIAPTLKEVSRPGETQGDFRIRLQQQLREQRDRAVEKMRQRYAPKVATLETQIRRAEERVARETSQFQSQTAQTAISVGSTIVRALLGRKWFSSTTVTSAASSVRTANKAAKEHGDIGRASENLAALNNKRADLEAQIQAEISAIDTGGERLEFDEYPVRPRKSDITIKKVALTWTI